MTLGRGHSRNQACTEPLSSAEVKERKSFPGPQLSASSSSATLAGAHTPQSTSPDSRHRAQGGAAISPIGTLSAPTMLWEAAARNQEPGKDLAPSASV